MTTITRSSDTQIVQRTNTFAAAKMLRHAQPVEILEKTCMMVQMPKNKGSNIKWRRPRTFAPAVAPLVEGVTPTLKKFEFEDVEATLRQYGDVVMITDVIQDLHEDPVGAQISIQMGENIGRTREALNWGVVRAATNAFFANGTQRTDVNTPITLNKQRAVIRALKAQKAMKFTSVLSASPDFATAPIEAAYIAVAHTNCESDIRNLPGFKTTAEYGSRSVICPEEIGSVEDVRYLLSPDLDPIPDAGGARLGMVSTSGTSADIYPIIFFGKEAWASVALRGMDAIGVNSEMPGKASKDDPLGQRGFVSWKMWHVARILNQNWMARLDVAVTAL